MSVSYLPCQDPSEEEAPLPYTASPLALFWSDVQLFFRCLPYLPGVFRPIWPWKSAELDELYPSVPNVGVITVHLLLMPLQLGFLISLPVAVVFQIPAFWILIYMIAFLWGNYAFCRSVFNNHDAILQSAVPVTERPEHHNEHWIFINGVGVGRHWLQHSVDRLAYTFGRRVTGVHNATYGVVFDVIECLIQRNFSYATQDVRDAYALTKKALLDPQYKKVVLILHSQGGIEGGLIIDWLLAEMPRELLQQLEVYTFGNAANHFNNPCKSPAKCTQHPSATCTPAEKSIKHIEHYANAGDFVCRWGLLDFLCIHNRYMGQVFVRPSPGHQLNQHYLDTMFPLASDRTTLDSNEFMETEVDITTPSGCRQGARNMAGQTSVFYTHGSGCVPRGVNESGRVRDGVKLKVKDLSRLWQYRNGRSPEDEDAGGTPR